MNIRQLEVPLQLPLFDRTSGRLAPTAEAMLLRSEVERSFVEHGTQPADGLSQDLKAHAANEGVTDLEALLALRSQPREFQPEARFELHRVGDAATSRNIHAAVLDSLRLCMAL